MQNTNNLVLIDSDRSAVSFNNIARLVNHWPYESGYRIAIELLALTGMRPCELDAIGPSNFWSNIIMWKPRKKQTGSRKEKLPEWFLDELDLYLGSNHIANNRLFNFTHNTLRRKLNAARKELGGDFLKKKMVAKSGFATKPRYEYMIQLRSFRKTFQCRLFHQYLEQYGCQLALDMVSKDMRHSSAHITGRHYVSDIKYMTEDLHRYKGVSMANIIKSKQQRKLFEFEKLCYV